MGLLFVTLIIAVILLFSLIRFIGTKKKIKKIKYSEKGNPIIPAEMLRGGNVSILFDKNTNVIIIPYAKALTKGAKASGLPTFLKSPYSPSKLGAMIKLTMTNSSSGKIIESRELMEALGNNNWKEYTQGKKSISVHSDKGAIIKINPTRRLISGTYIFHNRTLEVRLPIECTDETFGTKVLDASKHCKLF